MSETTSQSPTTPTYEDFVRKLFNRSGDPSKDFTHAALGIVTELHELICATDEVNAIEELGDLEFYLEAMAQVITDVDGKRPQYNAAVAEAENLRFFPDGFKHMLHNEASDGCNALLDSAKRWVGYGKQPPELEALYNRVGYLVGAVSSAVIKPDTYTRLYIRKVNMAKLLKRYPGGEFDAYHAIVRDLEAERAVLEAT